MSPGRLGNDVPLPPGNPYLSDLPQHDQDLDRARKLLADAGTGPLTLDSVQQRPAAHAVGRAGDEGCRREDRCDNQCTGHPVNGLRCKRFRKKATVYRELVGSPTLYKSLCLVFYSKARLNYSSVETSPGLDGLLEDIIAEIDPSLRKQLVAKALTKIHDSTTGDPYLLNYLGATSDKGQGFDPPQYDMVTCADLAQ